MILINYLKIPKIFCSTLKNPEDTLRAMVKYKSLPSHIEAVFIQNILKIFAVIVLERYIENEQYSEIIQLCDFINEKLSESTKSGELEVQERASTTSVIIEIVKNEVLTSKWRI